MNTKKIALGLLLINAYAHATEGQNPLPHVQACFKQKAGAVADNAPLSMSETIDHILIPSVTGLLYGAAALYEIEKNNTTLPLYQKIGGVAIATLIPVALIKWFLKRYSPLVADQIASDSYELKKNLSLSELESLQQMVQTIEIDKKTNQLTQESLNKIIEIAESTNFLKSTQKYAILDVVDKLQILNRITDSLREHFETLEQRIEEESKEYATLHFFRKGLDRDTKKLSIIISCLKTSEQYKIAYAIARQERLDQQNEDRGKAELEKISAEASNKRLNWLIILKELLFGRSHTIFIK